MRLKSSTFRECATRFVARSSGGALCLVLAGCAGSAASAPKPVHYAGNPDSSPSLDALPSADVDASALTHEMRVAQQLSAESLRVPDPVPPAGLTASELEQWSGTTLRRWMHAKQSTADAARDELNRAAEQTHRQRIMAGAMVGLLYEDLARVLLSVPPPAELASEPEILAIYRSVVMGQAAPYVTQARAAYEACAGNAEQLAPMAHWASFCEERAARLPGEREKPALGEGTTTVTIVAE